MMDKELIVRRFSRAVESYNREAVVQKQIACRMAEKLERRVPCSCDRVLEIGSGTGFLTRRLVDLFHPRTLILNDICSDMSRCVSDLLQGGQASFICGDAERISFPKELDLIASCSVLQWFSSPGRFFERCHVWLAEQGCLAFTTFGKNNLKEVTAVTGGGLEYCTMDELKALLCSRYEIMEAEEEQIRLTFHTPLDVLYHLKHTGVTALRQQTWTKGDLQHFCDQYVHLFGVNGQVPLTYHPVYILAKKRI